MSKYNQPKNTPYEVEYLYFSPQIQDLEGKILTLVDASISDPVQRKALKNLFSPMIWNWAIESNMAQSYDIKIKNNAKQDIVRAL